MEGRFQRVQETGRAGLCDGSGQGHHHRRDLAEYPGRGQTAGLVPRNEKCPVLVFRDVCGFCFDGRYLGRRHECFSICHDR